jgi:hypothetical protein
MISKTKFLFPIFLISLFFLGINTAVSQINLGSIENFTLYTSSGAIGNTAISNVTGDIGTNLGAITGFGAPSVLNGSIQNANSVTIEAALDLNAAVVQINSTLTTDATHGAVFGSETLTPDVYAVGGAASIVGTLTLDAQGDPNAEFIFKIGGAFTTAASATVVLINCASSENIFWLATGAIAMAASTTMSGNLISYPGAVSMGAGCELEGRLLSTAGAISLDSSIINISSTTINYWTGTTSSDWNNAENWTCSIPSDLNDAINIIPVVTTFPIIGDEPDNSGVAKNLEILSGASLTINNNSLRVSNNLILNGKIDLEGESQLLQDTGSVFDLASTGSIEIDQQGTGNSFRYNYLTSPVNSRGTKFTIDEVLRDGTDPNNIEIIDFDAPHAYADGAPSLPIKLSSYWMYKLEDSGLGYSAWTSVGNTGEINVGQGYTMKGSNASAAEQNYTFVGKPNNGIIELTVTTNNDHLVGNPYPSAIDADKFIDDNGLSPGTASITGTLYFWEHYGGDTHNLADYQAGYATYSKGGGVKASLSSVKGVPTQYIPVGQAFFVVGDADGGQIQFNNSQRIFVKESSGNSIFMGPNNSENSESKTTNNSGDDLRPKFRIGFDMPKANHRQVLLTIDENTTDAVDWGYDAEMYEDFDDDMYWVLNDKKYVIQATNELGLDKEIPIGIQTKEGGLISIKVDELENTEAYTSLYIKDNLTGEIHDITNQAFEINLEAGQYQNRFLLVFQQLIDTTEELILLEGVHIFMNNSISELQLNSPLDTEILNVSLFNYLGQQVKTWNINTDEQFISLPLEIASGVYIVIVETKTGKVNKKIVAY